MSVVGIALRIVHPISSPLAAQCVYSGRNREGDLCSRFTRVLDHFKRT